ncbi:hypothetical protein EDB87DRAFT_1211042 [Lactarius vividus]|nr:hypothetical protein EDB87DRAFT_1211042 [Lactarius vividus]
MPAVVDAVPAPVHIFLLFFWGLADYLNTPTAATTTSVIARGTASVFGTFQGQPFMPIESIETRIASRSLLPIRANAYSSQPLVANARHALHSGGCSSKHQRTALYSSSMASSGKRARLDSGHRTSREPERLADEQAQEGHMLTILVPTQKRGPNQQTDDGTVEPLGGEPWADSCTTSHPSQHMTLEGDWGTSLPERGRHDASGQGDENVCHERDAQA